MSNDGKSTEHRIDQFFSGPGARADQWRDLVEAAKAWAGATGGRAKYEALLNDLAVTEEFHGYPGLQLMAALKESAAAGDAATSLALSTRIVQALMTRSFRQHAGDWSVNEDGDGGVPDLLPPGGHPLKPERNTVGAGTLLLSRRARREGAPLAAFIVLDNGKCRPLDAEFVDPAFDSNSIRRGTWERKRHAAVPAAPIRVSNGTIQKPTM